MWHKPCRTFHPWCLCIKTRCLFPLGMRTSLNWDVRCLHQYPICSMYEKGWFLSSRISTRDCCGLPLWNRLWFHCHSIWLYELTTMRYTLEWFVLCREWQHKSLQRRPYEWSSSILPRNEAIHNDKSIRDDHDDEPLCWNALAGKAIVTMKASIDTVSE